MEFIALKEISAAAARELSFIDTLTRLSEAFTPPLPLVIASRQHILVALVDDQSAALSIIEPDGDIGCDTLTWVDLAWRHLGIATLLKRQAFQNARQGGITGL